MPNREHDAVGNSKVGDDQADEFDCRVQRYATNINIVCSHREASDNYKKYWDENHQSIEYCKTTKPPNAFQRFRRIAQCWLVGISSHSMFVLVQMQTSEFRQGQRLDRSVSNWQVIPINSLINRL